MRSLLVGGALEWIIYLKALDVVWLTWIGGTMHPGRRALDQLSDEVVQPVYVYFVDLGEGI